MQTNLQLMNDNFLRDAADTAIRIRNKAGLTQLEVSKAAGFGNVYVSQFEKKKIQPTLNFISKLCDMYNIKVDEFLLLSIDPNDLDESVKTDFILLQHKIKEYTINKIKKSER